MNPLRFEPALPILRVANLAASLAYYVDILGFKIDWNYEGNFASVSRDKCCLFLCEGGQGHVGAWTWLGVHDVEAAHAELRARGAIIRQPPTNFPWAFELQIADPDGNILRLGAESKPNAPFGPWLDMHGTRWSHEPDGTWQRLD